MDTDKIYGADFVQISSCAGFEKLCQILFNKLKIHLSCRRLRRCRRHHHRHHKLRNLYTVFHITGGIVVLDGLISYL